MADAAPSYPVYLSPDGKSEQIAATPAREVQLKYAGWTLLSTPRRRTDAKKQTKTD